jgi:hypothetical protein
MIVLSGIQAIMPGQRMDDRVGHRSHSVVSESSLHRKEQEIFLLQASHQSQRRKAQTNETKGKEQKRRKEKKKAHRATTKSARSTGEGGGAGYRRNEEGRPWEAVDRARKYLPVDPRHDQFNAEEQVRLGACELAESSADV